GGGGPRSQLRAPRPCRESLCAKSCDPPYHCLPVSPDDAAMGFARSYLLLDLPPPATAVLRSTVASQKSRFASIAVIVAAMRCRASASSANTSMSIAL